MIKFLDTAELDTCHVLSKTLTTFPSRLHLAVKANFACRILPVTSLKNLNLSEISFVTNTLSVLTFPDQSEFTEALEETLLVYLYPNITHPSFLASLIIVCSINFIANVLLDQKGFRLAHLS